MSALVFDCLFWLFGFLRMGTVALTAQALGAGDLGRAARRADARAADRRGHRIAADCAAGSACRRRLRALGGSDAVRAAAETYFFVRIWSAPCALANFAVLGWLVGIARAGTALALQIAINTVNIAFTVLLVLVLDYGIAGAATAALIAEACGLAIGLVLARRRLGGHLRTDAALVLQRDKLVRMLAINRDIMIRTAALIAAFAFFTAQGARAGDVALAANAVLHNFILIGSFFLDGLATAAEQLCGRSVGARDGAAFAQAARRVLAWGLVFGAATTILFLAVGAPLIDTMTTSAEVRQAARQFMLFAALAPVAGVAAYTFDGIYIGATWARDMRNLMMIALAIYLATWWALRGYGNAGLWMALLVFLIARGAAAGGALSGAGARDLRCIGADRLTAHRFTAATAPPSWPRRRRRPARRFRRVRRGESALDKSDLMPAISRRPWNTSAL